MLRKNEKAWGKKHKKEIKKNLGEVWESVSKSVLNVEKVCLVL